MLTRTINSVYVCLWSWLLWTRYKVWRRPCLLKYDRGRVYIWQRPCNKCDGGRAVIYKPSVCLLWSSCCYFENPAFWFRLRTTYHSQNELVKQFGFSGGTIGLLKHITRFISGQVKGLQNIYSHWDQPRKQLGDGKLWCSEHLACFQGSKEFKYVIETATYTT